jgi:hypothetical protein
MSPVQVARNGGIAAFESGDGRQLLYTKLSDTGIWIVPREGGHESAVWRGARARLLEQLGRGQG